MRSHLPACVNGERDGFTSHTLLLYGEVFEMVIMPDTHT